MEDAAVPYEQLPIVEVDLDDLRLDLDNYRLPTRPDDEDFALRYLFEAEDVMGAALLILREGYFDNEVPIAVRGPSGYVVLEGNRRVSALKALQKPFIVPSHELELRTLLKRFQTEALDLPTRIRVLQTPDRQTALPHIARLHTGLSKRRWSRDQQATFYHSLLDEATTVEDVKAMYPSVSVPRFMRMAVARRFLSGASFQDESLHQYVTGDKLAMSSFEYAYRKKDIATAVGLEFDGDGLLLPRGSAPEEIAAQLPPQKLKALEYLVSEFRANRLNTRSDAFKKGHQAGDQLLARLTGVGSARIDATSSAGASFTNSSGAINSGDGADHGQTAGGSIPAVAPPSGDERNEGKGGGSDIGTSPSPTMRGPNRPDTKKSLDLSGVDYTSVPVGLKRRYIELRSIEVQQFPAATAMLMRAVLESTIKWHYETRGSRVSGQLGDVMKRVRGEYEKVGGLTDSVRVISSGAADRPGSASWFNMASHSADFVIHDGDVRRAWEQIVPLIRHLLLP